MAAIPRGVTFPVDAYTFCVAAMSRERANIPSTVLGIQILAMASSRVDTLGRKLTPLRAVMVV